MVPTCPATVGGRGRGECCTATTSFQLLREFLSFGTDLVDELRVGGKLLPQRDGPRLRVGLGIVDRDLDVEMSEVRSPDTLANLGRLREDS
jgi:hypothetical protein